MDLLISTSLVRIPNDKKSVYRSHSSYCRLQFEADSFIYLTASSVSHVRCKVSLLKTKKVCLWRSLIIHKLRCEARWHIMQDETWNKRKFWTTIDYWMFIRILHSLNLLHIPSWNTNYKLSTAINGCWDVTCRYVDPGSRGLSSRKKNCATSSRYAGFLYPSFCISVHETQELLLESGTCPIFTLLIV